MSNRFFAVCGIVEIDGKILFVRHTYGSAKDRILIPGGFVRENEMPNDAVEREIFEETQVRAKAKSVMAVEFKPAQWCVVFIMDYIEGNPVSDNYENSEVLLLEASEAIKRSDITNLSREILKAYIKKSHTLEKSDYVSASATPETYAVFGI
ncbi:MAG: NUDIX hydrolase [Oscillospiraceae bacterium]|nr:NUDIX hydrolase [Oscillospiraceae bacterium]